MHVLAGTLLVASALAGAFGACLPDDPGYPSDGGEDATADTGAAAVSSTCGDGVLATLDDGGDAGEQCDPGTAASATASTEGVVGCNADCTIACAGLIGPSGHCYFLADPSADYQTALGNCASAAAHVVTIDSDDEAAFVRRFVDAGTSYRVGLALNGVAGGFTTPVEEPGWPASDDNCRGCYARGANDAGLFAGTDGGADCIVADANDRWIRAPSKGVDAGVLTVCEREPAGQRSTACGGALCTTLPATAGRKRYVISLGPATAQAAEDFCDDFDGGSLVVIESNEEREQLARELRMLVPATEHGAVQVWIGLARAGDAWKWDNGSDAGQPWAESEPSPDGGGHAFMRLDVNFFDTQLAKTDDGAANTQRIFVCQRN